MYEKTTDRTDPTTPSARLSGADKQLTLAIESLEAEAEAVDPDHLRRLEDVVEEIRAIDRELRTLEAGDSR